MRSTLRFVLFVACFSPVFLTGCDGVSADDFRDVPKASGRQVTGGESLSISRSVTHRDGVRQVKLSNGMTVVIKRHPRVPVVCVRAFVRAGGLYEGKWLGCGISHLTEHLVAQGAEHGVHDRPVATHQQPDKVAQIGGQANAYTSLAHTCYYISANSNKTAECVEIIADWIARPTFDRDDFRREHGVVRRELEMRMSEPQRQLYYAHMDNVFRTHPAAVPILGYSEPLGELTYDDVAEYHARMYVPQNVTLVVVGDVDTDMVLEKVKSEFAGYRRRRQPQFDLPRVEPIEGVTRVVKTHPEIREVIEEMSFRTVDLMHEDLHALDVLSYVLSNGRTSRLVKNVLRDKNLVTSVSSYSWTPAWGEGIFTVDFRTSPKRIDLAESAIIEELRRIIAEGVLPGELQRAKRQKVADFVRSNQTVEHISSRLGTDLISTGNVNFSADYTDRIQQVTAKQVRRAARKYFDFDNMRITRLTPRPSSTAPAGDGEPADRRESPRVEMTTLDNGLRVVLSRVPDCGLVSMAMVSKGGVLLENESTNGLGNLATNLSTRGTKNYTAEQIGEFFSSAGGSITAGCGNNTFYWRADTLEDHFPKALEIFSQVILHPQYPQKELDIFRPRLLASIDRIDEHWHSQAMKFFRKKFFDDSPYRFLPIGRKEVVRSATVEQISAWHNKHLKASSCVLAVYGQFDPDQAKKKIVRLFGELPPGRVEPDLPARPVRSEPGKNTGASEPVTEILKTDKNVAAVIIAQPGMTVDRIEDRLAMDVLDTLISGYSLPAGLLHNTLRAKRLVYVVHSNNWPGLVQGAFITYAQCRPEKVERVADIIIEILKNAAVNEPTQREIDRTVNTILTVKLLDSQDPGEMAFASALNELYGLGYDFNRRMVRLYNEVTGADVVRVADKYLRSGGWMKVFTIPAKDESDAPGTERTEGKQDESNQ